MLKLRKLVKRYGADGAPVVDSLDLDIAAGQLVTFLGPSGCGKTTTLRMIAGLERPDEGEIEIDGSPVYASATKIDIPANRRPIAMVFQSYAIWPHMDVFHNVSFPLESGKFRLSWAEIRDRTEQALATVGLAEMARRPSSNLSGGQQQRVALARALVAQPKVLLLDEPLSNLDVRLRDQMRDTIRDLHEAAGLTTIFVTHDQKEAMALSDRIIVLNRGKVVESGSPTAIYQTPRHPFTANFVGNYNILEGRIDGIARDGLISVQTSVGLVQARNPEGAAVGAEVHVYIRPDSLALARPEEQATGIKARVQSAIYQGGYWEMRATAADGTSLLVHAGLAATRRLEPKSLSEIVLAPYPDDIIVVPRTAT